MDGITLGGRVEFVTWIRVMDEITPYGNIVHANGICAEGQSQRADLLMGKSKLLV